MTLTQVCSAHGSHLQETAASGKHCGTARQHGQKPLTQRLLRLIGPGASMRVTCSELQEENQEEVMSYKQWAAVKDNIGPGFW